MKRIHSAVALAAATAVVLSACGSGGGETPGVPQNDGPVTKLTVLVTDSPSANFLKAAAEGYTAETGIDIEFVSVPNAQLPTKIILAGQANQATFDIAQFDALTMPTIVPSGALQPLDSFIGADEAYDINDFPEALQEYSQYEDTTYGIPLSTEPFVNFYRTDLYDELGLETPTTWEELNEQAQQFSDAGYFGYCGYFGPALSARAYTERLYASGGRLLDPETNEPLLDSDLAKQVMSDYIDLAQFSPESTYSSGQTGATTAFSQLDCAQMVAPSGWYGTLANPANSNVTETFATGAPPMSDEGDFEPLHLLYGWLIGVSAQSPQQQGAWDFLSYALGKDRLDTFLETGAPITGRTSFLEDASIVESYPVVEALPDGIEQATILPRIPELTEIMLRVSQTLSSIQSGQAELDPAMDQLNDDILAILIASGRVQP